MQPNLASASLILRQLRSEWAARAIPAFPGMRSLIMSPPSVAQSPGSGSATRWASGVWSTVASLFGLQQKGRSNIARTALSEPIMVHAGRTWPYVRRLFAEHHHQRKVRPDDQPSRGSTGGGAPAAPRRHDHLLAIGRTRQEVGIVGIADWVIWG